MSTRTNHSSLAKRLCRHARLLGCRFLAVLVALLLLGGLDAAAPALAETSFDLDIDGFGQAVAEFMDAAEFVDATEFVGAAGVTDAREATRPSTAAPPEFVNDALERVNASATTPLKTLTSSVLNAVVPWVCEHAQALAVAAAAVAGLALAHAVVRAREPEDFVPRD